MTAATARSFDIRPAVRGKVPVLVGLVGPSGSGKTFSALRLAAGFQRVTKGETIVIDTEADRALHYAKRFSFQHLPFGAPFAPLDYLAAIEKCAKAGATTVIVDSMSHEHEGPGGVLEMHADEVNRLAGDDAKKADRVNMLAWAKPKAQRRRLINSLLQLKLNVVFCFRAKEKLKIERGKEPEPLGWQAIAGEEFIYEMTLKCLLLPGADGVPTWKSEREGERALMKLPEQFRELFASRPQLTEDLGEQLARWGAGDGAATPPAKESHPLDGLVAEYRACTELAHFRAIEAKRATIWKGLGAEKQSELKSAAAAAEKRLAAGGGK